MERNSKTMNIINLNNNSYTFNSNFLKGRVYYFKYTLKTSTKSIIFNINSVKDLNGKETDSDVLDLYAISYDPKNMGIGWLIATYCGLSRFLKYPTKRGFEERSITSTGKEHISYINTNYELTSGTEFYFSIYVYSDFKEFTLNVDTREVKIFKAKDSTVKVNDIDIKNISDCIAKFTIKGYEACDVNVELAYPEKNKVPRINLHRYQMGVTDDNFKDFGTCFVTKRVPLSNIKDVNGNWIFYFTYNKSFKFKEPTFTNISLDFVSK